MDESIDKGITEQKKIHIDYTITQSTIERAKTRYKLAQGSPRYETITHTSQGVKI
jgi:hypothetical protein